MRQLAFVLVSVLRVAVILAVLGVARPVAASPIPLPEVIHWTFAGSLTLVDPETAPWLPGLSVGDPFTITFIGTNFSSSMPMWEISVRTKTASFGVLRNPANEHNPYSENIYWSEMGAYHLSGSLLAHSIYAVPLWFGASLHNNQSGHQHGQFSFAFTPNLPAPPPIGNTIYYPYYRVQGNFQRAVPEPGTLLLLTLGLGLGARRLRRRHLASETPAER